MQTKSGERAVAEKPEALTELTEPGIALSVQDLDEELIQVRLSRNYDE